MSHLKRYAPVMGKDGKQEMLTFYAGDWVKFNDIKDLDSIKALLRIPPKLKRYTLVADKDGKQRMFIYSLGDWVKFDDIKDLDDVKELL